MPRQSPVSLTASLPVPGVSDPMSNERVAALAQSLGGRVEGNFLNAADVRLRERLVARQISLDRLSVDGLRGIGPVVITGCRIGTLRLTNVVLPEGLIIEDCQIGSLDIRGARRAAVSIVRTRMDTCVLHECGSLIMDSVFVTGAAAISDPVTGAEIARSTLGSVRLTADGPSEPGDVRLTSVSLQGRLEIRGLEGASLDLHDLTAARTRIRSIRFDEILLRHLTIDHDLTMQGPGGREHPVSIQVSGIMGPTTFSVDGGGQAEISVDAATIQGDLTLAGGAAVRLGSTCIVAGVLRNPQGSHSARLHLEPGASVGSIQPPSTPVRSPAAAESAAADLLGGSGVTELSILHTSLRERPEEQDMAYFALRQAEQRTCTGARRITLWLRGQLFGWGVTFVHPLRTFLIGIIMTAAAIFAADPTFAPSVPRRVAYAVTAALGLWFNVATGMPAGLNGPGWALAAVACTGLGIAIITVVTAVAVRRLTR